MFCAVTAGTVILESPVCVSEGDLVTLRCLLKKGNDERATSDFTAMFFKNEVFIGSTHNGRMDLPAVSHSDEGLYGCKHPEGDSPKSFLAVAGNLSVVVINKTDSTSLLQGKQEGEYMTFPCNCYFKNRLRTWQKF